MKIEETFRVKHEDTEEQTKIAFIKEESKDMKIEEAFRVIQEDTEEQTGWFSSSKLNYFVLFLYTQNSFYTYLNNKTKPALKEALPTQKACIFPSTRHMFNTIKGTRH